SEPTQKEAVQREGGGGRLVQGGRSFKSAVAEEVDVGIGEGSSKGVGPLVGRSTKDVVWEVEVEEEMLAKLEGAYVGYLVEERDVQAIQNQL
ncbi:hypothetical protein A2U01_0078669, partial [Trifolium medium]|nr:hypothetical protein [Trifolium medium]